MKEIVRYGVVLTLICMVAAGLLVGVYTLTKPRIVAQAQAEEEASLKEILPQAVNFEPVKSGKDIIYYKAIDAQGKFIGIAFKAYADGYSSDIEIMVGALKDGTIAAIKILSQNETPGLGTRVTESLFTSQFKNKNISGLSQVQAITGATISSTAVIDAVKERMAELLPLIKNEK